MIAWSCRLRLQHTSSGATRRYFIMGNRFSTKKPVDDPEISPKANMAERRAEATLRSVDTVDNLASLPKSDFSQELSKREKLRIIVNDYGRTVIVFHIGISLLSLGVFYTIVSRGLDISPYVNFISSPLSKDGDVHLVNTVMSEGSTFLIAYAVHKLFAPIRIGVTLGFTPVLVKFLRKRGILKVTRKETVR